MFLPRMLRPVPGVLVSATATERIGEVPLSVLHARPGTYLAEGLASAVEQSRRWPTCVWLRADSARPAAIAEALSDACRHRWDAATARPAALSPAARLAATMQLAPPDSVVVLEVGGRVTGGIVRLLEAVRGTVADAGVSVVVVAESRIPVVFGYRPGGSLAADELSAVEDPTVLGERFLARHGDRSALVHDLLDVAAARPSGTVVEVLDRVLDGAGGGRPLLDRLTAELLVDCTADEHAALESCLATGYWHPQLTGGVVLGPRPWIVPLEGQWGWLRPVWRRSLERWFAGHHRHVAPARPAPPPATVPPVVPVPPCTVQARLLGRFELRIDGQAIEKWHGRRGVDVLRFLLASPRHACSRDALLEEFWAGVPPAAARNRLQVVVSGIRRVLADVTAVQVVEFADGDYRINPELRMDIDVERFERARASARRAERAGDGAATLSAYRELVAEYRGDFAADAPYGHWTLLPRETMRLAYLDALDRMSRILLTTGRVDDCVAIALLMLDADPCREDAHRLLMRCYAHQGRDYQALRQYEFCRRILAATLDARPDPRTTRLHHEIRAGSLRESALTE